MGPNEENHHFSELRQKVCLSIHDLVVQRGLTSLDGKLVSFVTKHEKELLPNSSQTATDIFVRLTEQTAKISFLDY